MQYTVHHREFPRSGFKGLGDGRLAASALFPLRRRESNFTFLCQVHWEQQVRAFIELNKPVLMDY
jgi:hypothetical protein